MITLTDIKVGWFLGKRQILRSSKWTTSLIIFVMFMTFLNLVAVTGILVGLVAGINEGYRSQFIGDLMISPLSTKLYIQDSQSVISLLKTLPQVDYFSARYSGGGTVEANYKERTDLSASANVTGARIVGIDPVAEDKLTHLSNYVVEGEYLRPDDQDQILIGSLLLDRYAFGEQPGLTPLKKVFPGTKVRISLGGRTREVTVKGIVKSKINFVATAIYIPARQFHEMSGVDEYTYSQIATRLKPGANENEMRDLLIRSGVGKNAKVQTFADSIPNGVADITNTFAMLGNMISSVGLVVASITIFIVIFINAITRRKFIGILKGIGITGKAIEISYVLQSLFYALCGSAIGLVVLYGLMIPAVAAHPINFPFSDGILVAPFGETMIRVALLVVATVIAGYIPARMIVKKNTLDSILGRN